jgi:hypothetical protein
MNVKHREAIRASGSTVRSETDARFARIPATIRHGIAVRRSLLFRRRPARAQVK